MKLLSIFSFALVLSFAASQSQAEGPWVGETGEQSVTASVVLDTFDDIWAGSTDSDGPGDFEQLNLWLDYSLAITDRLTMSFVTGATRATLDRDKNEPTEDIEGRSDTALAIKYLLVDEFDSDGNWPSMAAKFSLISKGTYDRSDSAPPPPINVHAPGDKADGAELLIQIGKLLDNGLAVFGEVGYRTRGQEVPDDVIYNIGINYLVVDRVSVFSRLGTERSRKGLDIGTAAFREAGTPFHRLKEEKDTIEFGASFTLSKSQSLSFLLANVFDGRNTGKSTIVSASYSHYF